MPDPAPVHLHTATTDPEAANDALRRLYSGARMGTVGELSSFSYSQDVDGDSELSAGRLRFRGSIAEHRTGCRRAVEFLHGALSQPVTVEDAARHAGLSTVELVRAFRPHAGTTPGAYLRHLRLAAAHQDLLRGDPAAGDTVREIALRWGLAYPGDFARLHRRAYGEPPSSALRR